MRRTSLRSADANASPEVRPSRPDLAVVRGRAVGRPLTKREREVLALLAEGLGTAAIARRLSIARATVRNHVQHILVKLQVQSRLAAVSAGFAMRLLRPPSAPTPSRSGLGRRTT